MPCVLQLQSSQLQVTDTALWQYHELDFRNIKIRPHLKFTVSGRSKQANIHTHVCNEVMLVRGSLRLAPTMLYAILR